MMRTFHSLLLATAAMAFLPSLASAEGASKQSAPPKPKANILNMLGASDMAEAASNLRKAGEAFERFGNALKTITPETTEALVEASRNLANMGQGFDPLGLKAAVMVIREQNQRIYALQKAEIQRLKEECERLRKQPAEGPAKPKRQRKGRKK